ncbi:MAG: hypothetical protein MRJ92_12185 [Nitrospira sp.]|nr:hypothetical protein [Nitrospira sp.]
MASQVPPQNLAPHLPTIRMWDVELLHVHVSRKGKLVNAEWALHPQIKADLSADEWKELGELMNKVTTIVGHRFSQALNETEPAPPGNA